MKTLFISDLHLDPQRPDIEACFSQFIHSCIDSHREIDALYILGDLFEVWIGDDASIPVYNKEIKLLKELSRNNINLFVMHGNRDFLLEAEFATAAGCTLIPDPYTININNEKIILSHGDDFCTDDIEYMQFKKMVRNSQWQKDFLSKPVSERVNIAHSMRQASLEKGQQKARQKSQIMDVNQDEVERFMQRHNAQTLIHGHTHLADTHGFILNKQTIKRIVLPDWKPGAEIFAIQS